MKALAIVRRYWNLVRRYWRWPSMRQFGMFILWLFVLGAIAFFGLFIYLERTLPDPEAIAIRRVSESTKIYDQTGEVLLYDIHGEERRTVVPWEQIPLSVRYATIAAEDNNFYTHNGFDLKGIARSALKDVLSLDFSQGGSTVTQQLVKNALLGSEKTPIRKLRELVLSIEIERRFSKDEILWMYLNQIPYGSNAYGVQAAAKTFFAKNASELDTAEAALLASVLQAPSYYSPYGRHTEELMARKDIMLGRMKSLGHITDEEYNEAINKKLVFKKSTENITAPHFVIMVKDYLIDKYGEEAVETGGFKVITTLNSDFQSIAEEVVSKYVKINRERYKASNAALVSLDPKTGDVWALVGSADYFDTTNQGNFNVAIDGPGRQPGSAFKPFAYAKAFQKGYSDSTILFDLKTEFNSNCSPDSRQTKDQYGLACYHPQNYDGVHRGPVTMRQGLQQSLNIPSVKTLYLAGVQDTIVLAKEMGITTLTEPDKYGLSLVLGGAEVHPIDLASAYGVFANDGQHNPWRLVLKVEDPNGNVLEEAETEPKRVLESQIARLINNVLSDNSARASVFGYNSPLYIPGYSVAAKTGTTQENRDAWVGGFTPDIATVVWTGNNDNKPMTQQGAGISASGPMWNEFMKRSLASLPRSQFPKPNPVSSSKIMLDGNYTHLTEDGARQFHNILYYVNREDPTGQYPLNPGSDPMFANWEWPVAQTYVPQHTPEPSPSPSPETVPSDESPPPSSEQ